MLEQIYPEGLQVMDKTHPAAQKKCGEKGVTGRNHCGQTAILHVPCATHGEDTGVGREDVEPEDRGVGQCISCHPILFLNVNEVNFPQVCAYFASASNLQGISPSYFNSQNCLIFSPCAVEEGEQKHGWMGVWQLAKVNPPHLHTVLISIAILLKTKLYICWIKLKKHSMNSMYAPWVNSLFCLWSLYKLKILDTLIDTGRPIYACLYACLTKTVQVCT